MMFLGVLRKINNEILDYTERVIDISIDEKLLRREASQVVVKNTLAKEIAERPDKTMSATIGEIFATSRYWGS